MKMKQILLIMTIWLAVSTVHAQEIVFIVNKKNPETSISKGEIVDIYKRIKLKWSNGETIIPLNQTKESGLKEPLFNETLGFAISEHTLYYNQLGNKSALKPPAERKSSKSVLAWVARKKGAIGYVLSTDVTDKVKVLNVQ